MRTITIDQNSLIPRFLSNYIDELPQDICKLRAVTAFAITMVSFAVFVVGMIVIGGLMTLDIIFSARSFSDLNGFVFLSICISMMWTVGLITIFFTIAEGISRLRKRRDRQSNNQTKVAKTFSVVGEMYHSAKERFCTKIEYR